MEDGQAYTEADTGLLRRPKWIDHEGRRVYTRFMEPHPPSRFHGLVPTCTPDRCKFSFRNGVYDARANTFADWEQLEAEEGDWCTGQFFDAVLPPDVVQVVREGDPSQYRCIGTPELDSLLDHHGITDDNEWEFDAQGRPMQGNRARELFFALLGRLIHPLGGDDPLERWDTMLFIQGVACSGVTSIVNLISQWYPAHRLGCLDSNSGAFALSHLRYFFVAQDCPDPSAHGIDRETLRRMIRGDVCSVPRRYMEPLVRAWTAKGVATGNCMVRDWDGLENLLVARFLRPLDHPDPAVGEAMCSRAGTTLVKCNLALLCLARMFGCSGAFGSQVFHANAAAPHMPSYFSAQ